MVGLAVGDRLGSVVRRVGETVGDTLGSTVRGVGETVGDTLDFVEGKGEGDMLGTSDGCCVKLIIVGAVEGLVLGVMV